MDWLQVIFLAVIQGLTEFLPISSSGHLVLPKELLGWPDQGLAFDVAVHIGSLSAVLLYFRHEVISLLQGWFKSVLFQQHSDQSHLAWCVILATVPAGLVGLLADDMIEQHLRSILVIASTTILFGIVLGFSDRLGSRSMDMLSMSWKLALVIGLAQVLALIPGTSRSGITISAALLLGFNRETAARFSFLLSIPLILAAGSLKTLELVELGEEVPWLQIIVGTLLSGATAFLCIFAFLKLIDRMGLMPFVVYRLLLGGGLLVVSL